jgi:disulfide bond formation protein DsbB
MITLTNLALSFVEAIRMRPVASAALTVAGVGTATIVGAWFFEHGLGLEPCRLCLEQRYPYYLAIPFAAIILVGEKCGFPRKVLLGVLGVIMLVMLWDSGLAAYHAGVEWEWWAGPQDCSRALRKLGSAIDLAKSIEDGTVKVVRCDVAAWRFQGISLAGYNAAIALLLAAVAAWGFWAGSRLNRVC